MTQDADVVMRRMRWWDLPHVVDLDQQLFPETAWTSAMFWSELAGVPSTRDYLVLDDGAEVVGYAGLMTLAHEATVQTIGVARPRQGTGLGRRLLDALVALAQDRAATQVWLEVREDNTGAQRLYAAAGFAVGSRRHDYYGAGRDALIMRLRLGGGSSS
jgi:[ribosomal protein S18]-alanine N-acetyltransferase